ncbi:hypothetical protein Pint_23773 [Pistacia integerrima]|uniref:Uncharacterized protein n=1 Tax=Pistacia integerrima TaxID=434235 RepID=A0ACC0YPF7_9ROSI|nr:hypothetical protein Pint_23773 [Pistacia integerrima]
MLFKKLLQTSPMPDHIFFVLLAILFIHPLSASRKPAIPTSRITVVGAVFCDTCSTNSFSKHSYFLPGVDVHIQCKFKANSPKTTEQIAFSVNRTTDKYGVYKLEIPHVDGVDCVDGMAIESLCQANLIGSSSSACNVPGSSMAANEISVKSKQDSLCIYSLKALSYKPFKRNVSLCGNNKEGLQRQTSFNSSKFFLPYYLPFQLTPLFPGPPSLPFPFPTAPPIFSPPSFNLGDPKSWIPKPPPPAFNPGDPRTWIPNIPTLSPPPPPAFNLGDPKTWIPNIPTLSPPPPPAFNLGDPRTWIPNIPILSPPPRPAFNLRDPRT